MLTLGIYRINRNNSKTKLCILYKVINIKGS